MYPTHLLIPFLFLYDFYYYLLLDDSYYLSLMNALSSMYPLMLYRHFEGSHLTHFRCLYGILQSVHYTFLPLLLHSVPSYEILYS